MSRGRQTLDGVAVQRVQVMLDEITIERAKALGDGNLSAGLRKMAKEAEMKVITYQAPNGETIDLSTGQVEMLERAQKWPRNSRGEEYCSVSHGAHAGVPTYSDAQLRIEVVNASHTAPASPTNMKVAYHPGGLLFAGDERYRPAGWYLFDGEDARPVTVFEPFSNDQIVVGE